MQAEIVEALAAEVALAIKRALTPLQTELANLRERSAGFEATLARLPAHEQTLGELRARVGIVETKATDAPVDHFHFHRLELERVAQAVSDLTPRIAAVESRPLVPGPPGDTGPVGPAGPVGDKGEAGPVGAVPEAWRERLAALDARVGAPAPALAPEDLTASFTASLRKELGVGPLRIQKRVIRDEHGRVDRVVEEPVVS